jgi:hypothetical protein
MSAKLSSFAARLRLDGVRIISDDEFNELALELFALQFKYNTAYQKICEGRRTTPDRIEHWTQVPFVPTAAFKELELSSIPPEQRMRVFHSSGTTEQKPSRHFHSAESMAVYEGSLWNWFEPHVLRPEGYFDLVVLTPPPGLVPHSSLVHMFESVRRKFDAPEAVFAGSLDVDGAWVLDFDMALAALKASGNPKLILGTAFSFVHLLDFLAEKNLRLQLPAGSRVMETGGYKNRSRTMPKAQLHSLITKFLGISREDIICEYGMSELSSQAYDSGAENAQRRFHFPSWARMQVVSPETGRGVNDGESGLIRIFDLANVFSVAAIQTEDLAVRHGDGFELIGRATLAEARGCSLMTA